MKTKKGQAAFEFLSTYGWAILTLMIMIGALSYFGIMDTSRFLPDRCMFNPDIICEDYRLTGPPDYGVDLKLRHNIDETILLQEVTCIYPRSGNATWTPSTEEWKPKQTKEVQCSPGSGQDYLIQGTKEKVAIRVTYILDAGGYNRTVDGEVYAKVQ